MTPADTSRLPRTLGSAIDQVSAALEDANVWFGHGTSNAVDEACWLVASALALDPTAPLDAQRQLTFEEATDIQHWLEKRVTQRIPLAYLTGKAWFAGLEFKVSPDVLIPRSPIAELIVNGLPLWPLADGDRVLDLCTGSGCIAIALATYFPGVKVTGTDLSSSAVALARENVEHHQLEERCSIVQGDLFEPISGSYSLIVSNPPYVSDQEYQNLPPEYGHEPGMALRCDAQGLDLPLKILHDAPDYLTINGALILETGNSADALQEALGDVPLTWLSFEHGGGGVASASRQELLSWRPSVQRALEEVTGVQ